MTLSDIKADLRSQARVRRRQVSEPAARQASLGVVDHGLAAISETWGGAAPGIVSGYLADGSELDIGPLMAALKKLGWSLALPVVMTPGEPLLFRLWLQDDRLDVGPLGISQPGEEAPTVRPDVVLAPLLAFDDDGYRLGQGGGFYDRTIAMWRADGPPVTVLGTAFYTQRVEAVPRDRYDQRLDGLISERGFTAFGK